MVVPGKIWISDKCEGRFPCHGVLLMVHVPKPSLEISCIETKPLPMLASMAPIQALPKRMGQWQFPIVFRHIPWFPTDKTSKPHGFLLPQPPWVDHGGPVRTESAAALRWNWANGPRYGGCSCCVEGRPVIRWAGRSRWTA